MKKILLPLLLLTLALGLSACKKEDDSEDRNLRDKVGNIVEQRRENRDERIEDVEEEEEDEEPNVEVPEEDNTSTYEWDDYGISFDYSSELTVALATWGPFIAIGEGLTIYPETDNPFVLLMGIQAVADAEANITAWLANGGLEDEETINGNTYRTLSYHNEIGDVDTTMYYYETAEGMFYLRVSETQKEEADIILESLEF